MAASDTRDGWPLVATVLPIPPTGTPYLDPNTGQVSEIWQRYLLSLQNSLATEVAPIDAQYWVSTSDAQLTNDRNIGALATGYVKITTAAGIATPSSTTTLPATDLSGTINDARLSSNVPLKNGSNTFTSVNVFPAGAGSSTVVPNGRVASIVAASPTTGTVEQLLATYAMPGDTLNVNGQALRITGSYTTAANANNKTVKVRVGGLTGTVILSYTSATNNGNVWFDATVTRRTSATAYGNGFASDGATSAVLGAAATPTLTGTVDIVVTGTTPTASGDMSLQSAIVEYLG